MLFPTSRTPQEDANFGELANLYIEPASTHLTVPIRMVREFDAGLSGGMS